MPRTYTAPSSGKAPPPVSPRDKTSPGTLSFKAPAPESPDKSPSASPAKRGEPESFSVKPLATDGQGNRTDLARRIDDHIGAQIRLRRILLGLAQTDVSTELGITFQQLQKYEHGTNRVSGSTLYALSKILRTSPAYFFEGLGNADEVRAQPTVDKQMAKAHNRILAAFNGLTHEAALKAVLNLATTLADIENTQRALNEMAELS